MLFIHTTPKEFENATIAAILDLRWRKTRSGKSRDCRDVIVFEKPRFQTVFRSHENGKLAFSDSSSNRRNMAAFTSVRGVMWT